VQTYDQVTPEFIALLSQVQYFHGEFYNQEIWGKVILISMQMYGLCLVYICCCLNCLHGHCGRWRLNQPYHNYRHSFGFALSLALYCLYFATIAYLICWIISACVVHLYYLGNEIGYKKKLKFHLLGQKCEQLKPVNTGCQWTLLPLISSYDCHLLFLGL
jgi:hypothetical protein